METVKRGLLLGVIGYAASIPMYSVWLNPLRVIAAHTVAFGAVSVMHELAPSVFDKIINNGPASPFMPWQMAFGFNAATIAYMLMIAGYAIVGINPLEGTTIAKLVGYPLLFITGAMLMDGPRSRRIAQALRADCAVAYIAVNIAPYYMITWVLNRL